MNAEDQRRLEELIMLWRRQIGSAQPGTETILVGRLDRDGHVSLGSHVQPPARYPLASHRPGCGQKKPRK